jgi:hypothetical protein
MTLHVGGCKGYTKPRQPFNRTDAWSAPMNSSPVPRLQRIAALAGRRPDPAHSGKASFPPAAVARVRESLRDLLVAEGVVRLVCSAAAGADLIALECAESLALRYRIVLPFSTSRFRAVSVVDRGPRWGEPFDRLIHLADARGDLVTLNGDPDADGVYMDANDRIIEEAAYHGNGMPLAIAVWDGHRRDTGDATADFLAKAAARGFDIRQVATNQPAGQS